MGIKISESSRNTLSSLSNMINGGGNNNNNNNSIYPSEGESGIDHGSRFAKSLGFYDDYPWEGDDVDEVSRN